MRDAFPDSVQLSQLGGRQALHEIIKILRSLQGIRSEKAQEVLQSMANATARAVDASALRRVRFLGGEIEYNEFMQQFFGALLRKLARYAHCRAKTYMVTLVPKTVFRKKCGAIKLEAPPFGRLRRVAELLLGPRRTSDRIDPIIADTQFELFDAIQQCDVSGQRAALWRGRFAIVCHIAHSCGALRLLRGAWHTLIRIGG